MAHIPLTASVTGMVWKIEKQRGDAVEAGEAVLILESMKMEIFVGSPEAGVLRSLAVAEGESVDEGQVVAVIDTSATA